MASIKGLAIQIGFERVISQLSQAYGEKYNSKAISFLISPSEERKLNIQVLNNLNPVENLDLETIELGVSVSEVEEGFSEAFENLTEKYQLIDPKILAIQKNKVYTLLYNGRDQVDTIKIKNFI